MNGISRQNGVDHNGDSMDIIAERHGKLKGNFMLNKSFDQEYKLSPARNQTSSCHISGRNISE